MPASCGSFMAQLGPVEKRNLPWWKTREWRYERFVGRKYFPWLSIAKSFRLAVTLRLMTFGAAAVLLTLLGWWAIAGIFSHEGAPNGSWTARFRGPVGLASHRSHGAEPAVCGLDSNCSGRGESVTPSRTLPGLKIHVWGPMIRTWAVLSQPVWRILSIQPSGGRVVDGQRFPCRCCSRPFGAWRSGPTLGRPSAAWPRCSWPPASRWAGAPRCVGPGRSGWPISRRRCCPCLEWPWPCCRSWCWGS